MNKNKSFLDFMSTIIFLIVILTLINLTLWIPLSYLKEPSTLLESIVKFSVTLFIGFMNLSLLIVIFFISKDEYTYHKYYKNEQKRKVRRNERRRKSK